MKSLMQFLIEAEEDENIGDLDGGVQDGSANPDEALLDIDEE